MPDFDDRSPAAVPILPSGIALRRVAGAAGALDRLADGADAEAGRGFLRAAWFARAGETLVAERPGGVPLLAIPVASVGHSLTGVRAVPGSYWPFRSAAIAADARADEVAAVLAHPVARAALGVVLRLGPVYADDPLVALLAAVAEPAGWRWIPRTVGQTWLLDPAIACGRSSAKRVASYARKLAEAQGATRIVRFSGCGWSEGVFTDLARIEAASWVGTATDGSGAKFLRPDHRAHWRAAVRDPVLARMIQATILYCRARPVAFSFDLIDGPVQYAIASSYDEAFTAFRPGRIVTQAQLAHARGAGVTRVDLGAGDSGYKREMGALPGPEIIDLMMVRSRAAAPLIARLWDVDGGAADVPPDTDRAAARARLGDIRPWMAIGAMVAAGLAIEAL